jgi:hypothetical protein
MKYAICILIIFLVSTLNVHAQTADEEARVLLTEAQDLYDSSIGNPPYYRESFQKAEQNIRKAMSLIGQKPKLLYLSILIYYNGFKYKVWADSEGNYQLLANQLKNIFSQIDKATYPAEKYTELIKINLDVKDKLAAFEQPRQEKLNKRRDLERREIAFVRDTFNVYMSRFVEEFNELNQNYNQEVFLKKREKYEKKYMKQYPVIHHLAYNSNDYKLIVYSTVPDGKASEYFPTDTLYTLCPIIIKTDKLSFYYNGRLQFFTTFDGIILNHPFNQSGNRKSKLRDGPKLKMDFDNSPGRDPGSSFLMHKIPKSLYDLTKIMKETGFEEYFAERNASPTK